MINNYLSHLILFILFLGDGNVMRKVPIPIYMIFPRLFTCPTLSTPNFKLGILYLTY